MVEKVKEFLGKKFAQVEVVVHLRPQVDVAVSLASTAARFKHKIISRQFINENPSNPFYNYDSLIERWETVFGADRVTIVPFKNQPCMTSFLINKLDLQRQYLTAIERKNESIDWRVMALVNTISVKHSEKYEAISYNRNIFINDFPFKDRLSLGIEIAKEFQAKFEESNNQLINRRKELREDDLTPDWKKYDIPANIHHLDEPPVFAEQLSYLVMRFNWENKLEQCSKNLAKCEQYIALNNLKKAGKFLEVAKEILQKVPKNEAIESRYKRIERKTHKLERVLDSL
jgi:hypothetical protein